MDALEKLLLEAEKHGVMRGHVELMAEARRELQKYQKNASVTVCAYCGHETLKSDGAQAVIDHIMSCEKRPERILLDGAFEVEDRLYGFLNHVTGENSKLKFAGFHPHECRVCEEIAELLRIYNEKEES